MFKRKKLDRLNRLVHLVSDENELLSRVSGFMQHIIDNKNDITAKLQAEEDKRNKTL